METPEKPKTARAVANWFAGKNAPQASPHYCIDDKEIIQCVYESVIAWCAPKANRHGIHLEHAGYASQKEYQWGDEYSQNMLRLSAKLAAELCIKYSIPVKHLSIEELKHPLATGFCGHKDVTIARNNGVGHYDPGRFFPWNLYLTMVDTFIEQTEDTKPDIDKDNIT